MPHEFCGVLGFSLVENAVISVDSCLFVELEVVKGCMIIRMSHLVILLLLSS